MEPKYFTVSDTAQNTPDDFLRTLQCTRVVLNVEKTDKANALPVFSVADLFGEHVHNLRFFFTAEQFATYTLLKMARRLLLDGARAAVYIAPSSNTALEVETDVTNHVKFLIGQKGSLPAVTSTLQVVLDALQGIVFYQGTATMQYLEWTIRRFEFNFQKGYSSVADTPHTGIQGDRLADFAFEWPSYAVLFGVEVSFDYTQAGSTTSVEAPDEYFEDGTAIHPLLKPYFVRNYRLRLACGGNPFLHRDLFTDVTVVTGEEQGAPLTAMAECIWQNRPDLQKMFPNPRTIDRAGYLYWYVNNAASEYGLEDIYLSTVREALAKTSASEPDKQKGKWFKGLYSKAQAIPKREYARGVNLCAHIRGEYGIGEASRMLACTLQAAGEPFTVVDIASERDRDYSNTQWMPHITNTFPYKVNILYTNADGVEPFVADVSPDALDNRYNIGFWAWEMPEFPDEWVPAFEPFDEIWTLSQFSADAIAAKSPVPVYSMPHPVVLDAPEPRYTKEYFGLPQDSFVFLCMFDVRSVPERKNPIGTVKAFLQAFKGQNTIHLAIKVNAPEGWEPEGELAELLAQSRNIKLIDSFLARNELNGLLAACDAYVSLHRCEGFGFGPAEAMFYGKPAIVTNWSGSMEYTDPQACCPVKYTLVELQQDYGPYKKGWHWAEPDIDDAANKMN